MNSRKIRLTGGASLAQKLRRMAKDLDTDARRVNDDHGTPGLAIALTDAADRLSALALWLETRK